MLNARAWQKELTRDPLQSVYLLAGEELLVIEAGDALCRRARELGYTERVSMDAGSKFDWNELASAGAALSLFATRRCFDLRLPSGRPGRKGAEVISQWCAHPPADTILLIRCTTWSRKHAAAWSRAIEQVGIAVQLTPPSPDKMAAWLGERLRLRGLDADADALNWLAQRTEGNLLAATQEIDKLAILCPASSRLLRTTLETLVLDSARYDAFGLVDAILLGDSSRAMRVLRGLRAEGEDLVPLLGLLVSQLGVASRLASATDFSAQARLERLWSTRQSQFRCALGRQGNARFWQRLMVWAGRIDRMSKGQAHGNPWIETERLLVAICQPRAAAGLAKV
ncbi:MAG TPA: DNA polymerase III subunit delta [Mizugakiibacter sp.]|nr:DNA polymerase III subunit delta [Mizugakiibacter sp.]